MKVASNERSVLKKALSGAARVPAARTSTQRMGTAMPAEYHRAVPVANSTCRVCPSTSAGNGSAYQQVVAAAATCARPGRRAPFTRERPRWPG